MLASRYAINSHLVTPFGEQAARVIQARGKRLEDAARRGYIGGDSLGVRRAVLRRFASYVSLGCKDADDMATIIDDCLADSANARQAWLVVKAKPHKDPKVKYWLVKRLQAQALECCQRTIYARDLYKAICNGEDVLTPPNPRKRQRRRAPARTLR